MKKILTTFCWLCVLFATSQTTPVFYWEKDMRDLQGRIVVDPSGNVILAGTFTGTADFDPGPGIYTLTAFAGDAFIAKYGPSGNFIWACQTNSQCPLLNSHKVDAAGNIYSTGCIVSSATFDSFIWKVDASGNTVWLKHMGGSYADNGIDIEVDPFGNVYTTGVFSSVDTDFDPGPGSYTIAGTNDGYLSKLDANGNFLWAKAITSTTNVPYSCVPWGIVVNSANGVYICGQFQDTIDLDPGSATYSLATTVEAHDGFVAKYDTAGNFVWGHAFETSNDDASYKIIKSPNGIYLAGYFNGIADLDPSATTYTLNSVNGDSYILKINSNGNLQWARQAYFSTSGLEKDNNFNLYTIGGFYLPTDFDPGAGTFSLVPTNTNSANGFLCKLDSSGLFKWAVQLQDTGYSGLYSVGLDNVGDIYMSGFFNGRVDFDPASTSYTSAATSTSFESFLLKFALGTVGVPKVTKDIYFHIYPNPVSDVLFIGSNDPGEIVAVTLFNSLGQKLKEYVSPVTQIDLKDQACGNYYLLIKGRDRSEVKQIIVR
jgi:hypothetical protein